MSLTIIVVKIVFIKLATLNQTYYLALAYHSSRSFVEMDRVKTFFQLLSRAAFLFNHKPIIRILSTFVSFDNRDCDSH